MKDQPKLPQNELLAELLAKNADDAVVFKGYIGPDRGKDRILLYENLIDLSKCFEIKISDILHHTEAPKSILPFGGVILWLKKDSEVISRETVGKSESITTNNSFRSTKDEVIEIRAGRLQIIIENAKFAGGQPCHHDIYTGLKNNVF